MKFSCLSSKDHAPFVHVCQDCVDTQINEANLLEKNSSLLCSTLLFPSSLICTSRGKHFDCKLHGNALQLYIKGMSRDCDRTQRTLLLDQAVQLTPNFREALFWSAILDFRDVRQNVAKLRHALSLTCPSTCKWLVIQSQISVIQRNLHKALEMLNQAFDIADNDGERGEVAYFRAYSNWWIDRDTDAINDFNIALSFHYNVKSCYTQLAEIYAHLGKPRNEIEAFYQKSLLPSPKHTELMKYGVYLKRIQDFDRALLMFTSAKERNPLSPDSFEEMAVGPNRNREENCLTAVRLDEECRLVHSRRTLAAIYADNNHFDLAIQVLSEGLKKKEKFEWYCLRGQLYLYATNKIRDRYLLSVEDLRKAVLLNPLYTDAQYWLGKALEKNVSSKAEVVQRYSNVLYLSPNYPRIPESVREHILSLAFKFYDGEADGLLNFFLYGSNHISLSQIHRYLSLLANSGDPKMLYILFRDYHDLFESWIVHNKFSETAIATLRILWNQNVELYYAQQSILNSIPSNGSKWADLHIKSLQMTIDRSIALSDSFTADCLESVSKPILELILAFLYRKDITVPYDRVEKLLQLINHGEALTHSCSSRPKQAKTLNQFLYRFATKRNMLFKNSEEPPAPSSWTDSLTDEESGSLPSDSPMHKIMFQSEGFFKFDTEDHSDSQLVSGTPLSAGETVLLPFSQIPKELSKLVNKKTHSNITFLFPKANKNLARGLPLSSSSSGDSNPLAEYDRLYGHKEIIESKSRYFEAMFHFGLKESGRNEIIVKDIEIGIFHQVLIHLYGGQVRFTPDNCISLLQVADKLCLDSLKLACELYIGTNIEMSEEFVEVFDFYGAPRLKSLWAIRDVFRLDDPLKEEELALDDVEPDSPDGFLWEH